MSTATPSTRNTRKALIGFVTSRSGDKSIKVTIPYKTPHPLYHKVINRKTVVHAHDEKNETKVGDKVEIMETRPMSRLKRWRIISVVERTEGAAAEAISEKDVAETVPTKTTRAGSGAPAAGETPATA
jgi:small subunit ribosomal protein S17